MAAPASLFVRTSLALGVSAVAIVVTTVVALNTFVVDPIVERSADDVAALLVLSAQTWVELPPEARPYFELELAERHDLIVSGEARDLPLLADGEPFLETLRAKLSQRLGLDTSLRVGDELVWADIPMGGYRLQIGLAADRRDVQPIYVGLTIFGIGAAIVFVTSFLVVERITRPLVAAAASVEAFRGGEEFTNLPETGPSELVTLARSFNTMAKEISELISNRTTLLAGISHDLRTPLARMRLAVELLREDVDPQLRHRLERNLEEMDALLTHAMQFARGLSSESVEETELRSFLQEFARREDVPLRWSGTEAVCASIAPGALQRVLENLVHNARLHGHERDVCISTEVNAANLVIHVMDRGEGIPPAARNLVFQPFYRLEASRSHATGGSGLGLAIVRQLCQAQGWTVEIFGRAEGGTDVAVTIPLAGAFHEVKPAFPQE
ncbi:MAG: ATP-binding protein [Pseudomonadales bacterium]